VAFTKDWPHDVIFSDELDHTLVKGTASQSLRSLSARRRADLLKTVGLKSGRHWRDGKQARGYRLADIRRAAEQYIRPDTCDG
jgi:hypothetical protein